MVWWTTGSRCSSSVSPPAKPPYRPTPLSKSKLADQGGNVHRKVSQMALTVPPEFRASARAACTSVYASVQLDPSLAPVALVSTNTIGPEPAALDATSAALSHTPRPTTAVRTSILLFPQAMPLPRSSDFIGVEQRRDSTLSVTPFARVPFRLGGCKRDWCPFAGIESHTRLSQSGQVRHILYLLSYLLLQRRIVLVQRELDNPSIVLSNSPPRAGRGPWCSSLPPAGVLGLGSGTAGGRHDRRLQKIADFEANGQLST